MSSSLQCSLVWRRTTSPGETLVITHGSSVPNTRRVRLRGPLVASAFSGLDGYRSVAFRLTLLRLADEPDANRVRFRGGRGFPPCRQPKCAGTIVPSAASYHALETGAVPVLAPLGDIPEHVVQPPSIRRLGAHRLWAGRAGGPLRQAKPGNRREIRRGVLAGARRVFPLRLGGQPVTEPVTALVEPVDEVLRVFPGDALDWLPRSLETARILPRHRLPEFLRHLGPAHLERRDSDATDRSFVVAAGGIALRTSHLKCAGRNRDEAESRTVDGGGR